MTGNIDNTSGSDAIELCSRNDLLTQALSQLGIAVEQTSPLANPVITRKGCEQAGVSFEFFQSFAKLSQPSDSYKARMNWGARYFETRDRQLDRIETMTLIHSLRVLDTKNGFVARETDPQKTSIKNLEALKSRINLLGANPCWLGDEALKTGLLASLHGNLQHEMHWMTGIDGKSKLRVASMPFEFGCKYLAPMEPLVHALSYGPAQLPSVLQKAAESTVRLEVPGQPTGSGVVVHPGYILTARHVIGDTPDNKVTVTMDTHRGGQILRTEVVAEVIKLPAINGAQPDLALLYLGKVGTTPAPLQIAEAVTPGQDLYLLGYPGQESETPLMQAGILDVREDPKSFYVRSTAIGLPGDSGGPVVDVSGKIVGITKAAGMDGEDSQGNYSRKVEWVKGSKVETAKITGSYMYRMDLFAPMLRAVIAEDQKRRMAK
jgi:Trypsin-like serine proteases, typically periplasmic, contain C-terminal PDZ domain